MSDMRLPGAEMAINSLRDLTQNRRADKQRRRDSLKWGLDKFLGMEETKQAQQFTAGEAQKGREHEVDLARRKENFEWAFKGLDHGLEMEKIAREHGFRAEELDQDAANRLGQINQQFNNERKLLEQQGAQQAALDEWRAGYDRALEQLRGQTSRDVAAIGAGKDQQGKIMQAVDGFMESYYSDKTDFGRGYTSQQADQFMGKYLDAMVEDGMLTPGQRGYAEEIIRERIPIVQGPGDGGVPGQRQAGGYQRPGVSGLPQDPWAQSEVPVAKGSEVDTYRGILRKFMQASKDSGALNEASQLMTDLADGEMSPAFLAKYRALMTRVPSPTAGPAALPREDPRRSGYGR